MPHACQCLRHLGNALKNILLTCGQAVGLDDCRL